ncbi:MerR family transcriptional regulator [Lentzea atacamensis]|uniref:MerR family transcriptional regulator n=2 Tax=Lentzea TaxID=165301 RepID=A0A316HLJ0_9PSEU|nr:MerR family transcriptional regulator [Lentzea atacamensis]PWK80844.1 MerR family transcriptional regulator [Lentzea atacamensis]RAS66689.1 MerR family transcriptional regulator [Lentzea atacamensis]
MLIGELAAACGVSARSVRYYEQCGLLTSTRSSNGYRTYSQSDVETVRRIKALLNVGLPIATIAQLLPCVLDASPRLDPCTNLIATLRAEVDRLDAQAAEIARCRSLITGILERST